MATNIGKPWLIQLPPWSYHLKNYSWTKNPLNGMKLFAQWLLKLQINPPTIIHGYFSSLMLSGQVSGCILNQIHGHNSSKRFRSPVSLPICSYTSYLADWCSTRKLEQLIHLYFVQKIISPMNFNSSVLFVSFQSFDQK
jgi:hypothetical protein